MWHRHVIRLPENTSELCVQSLITARPVPSRAACWPATVERSRALFKDHWYLWNVAAAQLQPGLLLPGMLVFHLLGVQSRDSCQGPDPLGKPRPDLGALHAGDGGVCASGAVTRDTDGRRRTPRRR